MDKALSRFGGMLKQLADVCTGNNRDEWLRGLGLFLKRKNPWDADGKPRFPVFGRAQAFSSVPSEDKFAELVLNARVDVDGAVWQLLKDNWTNKVLTEREREMLYTLVMPIDFSALVCTLNDLLTHTNAYSLQACTVEEVLTFASLNPDLLSKSREFAAPVAWDGTKITYLRFKRAEAPMTLRVSLREGPRGTLARSLPLLFRFS